MTKVFISWSGDRSKAIAEELRDWLPTVVQSIEPFISTQDVPIGGRGLSVLASELQDCSFGILCLTEENKKEPWIHFEAGALSKVIEASRVVPLLFDLKITDLTGPLIQFQAIAIEDRDGVFALIKALSEQSSPPVTGSRLQRLFDMFWPELEAKVSRLKVATEGEPRQDVRSEREILEEILLLSRNTERQISGSLTIQAGGSALSSRITLSVIRDAWSEILDRVRQDSRVAGIIVSNAVPADLADGLLTITFPREGDAKSFRNSRYERILEEALYDVVGFRFRIQSLVRPGVSLRTSEPQNTAPPSGYSSEPPF
jgi:hypothetical protein